MQQVTIANGQSTSTAVELSQGYISGIFMPASWTAAPLTLEGSVDGAAFLPLYDAAGVALRIEAAADRMIVLPADATQGLRYVRLRSGTLAAPINQGAERAIKLEVSDR